MRVSVICFLSFFVIASSVLSWQNMIYRADTLPEFYNDEVPNTQSAVSFFKKGVYKNDRYGLPYSSGIAVTWPSVIGLSLGHSLLGSRLASTFFTWICGLLLGFWFFRRSNLTVIESAASAVFIWGCVITPPLALPYWFGFMYNLGELNTAILIGCGLLMLSKNIIISMLIFGVAFGYGKFSFFPLILAIILGEIFSQRLSVQRTLTQTLKYILIFMLPLAIGMAWTSLRFSPVIIKDWFFATMSWLKHNESVDAHKVFSNFSWEVLRHRLTSPQYEWVGYSLGTKMKNLLFSLGAIGITCIGLFSAKRKLIALSSRQGWITFMAALAVGFYSLFYFFNHPFMWQRHFHQGIYTGCGLFVFWCIKWLKNCSCNLKPFFYTAAAILIILQTAGSLKHPIIEPKPTYARSCTDLYSAECDPTLYTQSGQIIK